MRRVMKNREYYKDEIFKVACKRDRFAVNKITKEIDCCLEMNCCDCLFDSYCCGSRAMKWLEEEHVEPVLDDVEKRYLENVVRPFRNRVRSITKRVYLDGFAYLQLHINSSYSYKQQGELINLPLFVQNKMYQNMTIGKKYTLKDLELFESEEE